MPFLFWRGRCRSMLWSCNSDMLALLKDRVLSGRQSHIRSDRRAPMPLRFSTVRYSTIRRTLDEIFASCLRWRSDA
ncbi:hypothetical protein PHSY_003353 [Pseudozyma hubeiensis SY62]|uniref:Uncharacterized protein n=1 Tax=Pseudozyma hubeiensis (strain SY62) TaxID=1305764 RepID=R9P3F0_PSEHS|nr:hypothetical protein PHSY_003353 [Pseudozyma hubeiensis SY62]GAC95777.1 hypothetical protein PHSY_003353 [Pseudozyma hubeiensis SY62]